MLALVGLASQAFMAPAPIAASKVGVYQIAMNFADNEAAKRAWMANQDTPTWGPKTSAPRGRRGGAVRSPSILTKRAPVPGGGPKGSWTLSSVNGPAVTSSNGPIESEIAAHPWYYGNRDANARAASRAGLSEECDKGDTVACETLSKEDDAKLEWLQYQTRYGERDAGKRAARRAALAAQCDSGDYVACDTLSKEDEAKAAWLAKLDAPKWGPAAKA